MCKIHDNLDLISNVLIKELWVTWLTSSGMMFKISSESQWMKLTSESEHRQN
jgi:hypothetical protein